MQNANTLYCIESLIYCILYIDVNTFLSLRDPVTDLTATLMERFVGFLNRLYANHVLVTFGTSKFVKCFV